TTSARRRRSRCRRACGSPPTRSPTAISIRPRLRRNGKCAPRRARSSRRKSRLAGSNARANGFESPGLGGSASVQAFFLRMHPHASAEDPHMRSHLRFGIASLVVGGCVAVLPVLASAAEFRAASAKADLTPSGHENLWGYSNRKGPATGTHDPLYGKI